MEWTNQRRKTLLAVDSFKCHTKPSFYINDLQFYITRLSRSIEVKNTLHMHSLDSE